MINNDRYEVVIGLEVHAQLLTNSKLFSGDSANFSTHANTQVSPITLAHPGTLPMMNSKAIEYALKLGLALHCDIEQHNYFARKNYFYSDLPKGYQVSQHTTPICKKGVVPIVVNGNHRNIQLNRIHIEEDAGKSLHDVDKDYTSIDLNRAGVPLLEIVSEPNLYSSDEAFAYITELRKLVRWINICDGNMEEGSMRCDANISVRLKGSTTLGTRVEVKNLNSIRNVKKAIDLEAIRLINLIENGEVIKQETRSFDADSNTTFALRSKEDADDYRYFAEPDLTPFYITDKFLQDVKNSLPPLPAVLIQKYINEFQLSNYDATVLCDDKDQTVYFENILQNTSQYKAAANWILGPIKNNVNENNIAYSNFEISAKTIAELIELVHEGKLSFGVASTKIFLGLLNDKNKTPLQIATEQNLLLNSDNNLLEQWVGEALAKMPEKVMAYKKGQKGLIGLFAGEVKKLSKGTADMQMVTQLLTEKMKD